MSNGQPGWELYRTFIEVARTSSLSAAARRLGLSQPTAGRHIQALEEALGLTLFSRSPRGLIPTPAASDLMPHAVAMAAASAALLRAASGEAAAERGAVRLTASEVVGCEVLPPVLAAFRAKHPAIDLELVLSNRNEDLLRREADIAVRMVRPVQQALTVRRIGKVKIGLYAHRRYAERCGLPATADELPRHCWIGFDRDDHSFRSAGPSAAHITREMFGFRCDSDLGQMAALRAGMGIGGCQVNLARRDPDLVPVLADTLMFELEMWLAMHESLRTTRRVRLLFDHLAGALAGYVRGEG
jgi:DNA-binding transcriptional LysR family regulator